MSVYNEVADIINSRCPGMNITGKNCPWKMGERRSVYVFSKILGKKSGNSYCHRTNTIQASEENWAQYIRQYRGKAKELKRGKLHHLDLMRVLFEGSSAEGKKAQYTTSMKRSAKEISTDDVQFLSEEEAEFRADIRNKYPVNLSKVTRHVVRDRKRPTKQNEFIEFMRERERERKKVRPNFKEITIKGSTAQALIRYRAEYAETPEFNPLLMSRVFESTRKADAFLGHGADKWRDQWVEEEMIMMQRAREEEFEQEE